MLPQSISHRHLILQQQSLHKLLARPVKSNFRSAVPLPRCQAAHRGTRQDFQKDAQNFGNRTQQSAENFWERSNAQEKAQAATSEASKRYVKCFCRICRNTVRLHTLDCAHYLLLFRLRSTLYTIYLLFRLRSTFQTVSAGVKQTAGRVNERFDLSGKAQQTADR